MKAASREADRHTPLAGAPSSSTAAMIEHQNQDNDALSIAVIGMAGRFPRSPDLDTWWTHLSQGVECVEHFSRQELEQAGVAPELLDNPHLAASAGRQQIIFGSHKDYLASRVAYCLNLRGRSPGRIGVDVRAGTLQMNNISIDAVNALSVSQRDALRRILKSKGVDFFELPIPRRPHDLEELALSHAQQRLWFLDRFESGSPLYTIANAVHLAGRLDEAALESSINAVVQRHEILRTRFIAVDGVARQQIAAQLDIPLPRIDLRTDRKSVV